MRTTIKETLLVCSSVVVCVVMIACISADAQNRQPCMSTSTSSHSANWAVINSGGAVGSTSNYTIHSGIGEAVIDNEGSGHYTGSGYLSPGSPTPVEDCETANQPASFELSQNYPNPFNPSTTIEFTLPERSFVNLCVYNIVGQKVAVLLSENLSAGYKRVTWDGKDQHGTDIATGVYLYKLSAGEYTESRKMLLIR
ncbi:MAG: T9SS type A sorting domain-containing protein [bacterium]